MHRFLLLIACFIAISPKVDAQSDPCHTHQCLLVVDAGSTGSRSHLFAYDNDETNTPVGIHEIWSNKIKPGFATLDPNPRAMDAYLTRLLNAAPTHDVPVYFYATAGMRLLSPAKQTKYYQALQSWFSQQEQWKLIESKTITGQEEALYDWLSVNYNLGTLSSIQTKAVGVMDMGGASVQIVFPIQNNQELDNKTQVKLGIYGQKITLSVHSFLGLGQTEMSHQFLNSAACFANDFPLPDGESGQGNAPTCEQEVSSLMTSVHRVHNQIKPLLAANPVDSWYAIGGLSNLAGSQLFHFEKNELTNTKLLAQADEAICHQQWDKLNTQYPNEDYLYEYCLFSSYYYALMVDGYGLYPDQVVNYLAPEKNIDWTTGVVLYRPRT